MKRILWSIIGMLILVLCACTSTKYIEKEIPVETVRTEYINKLYRDSIFVHDSIDRYISDDTVYQYKYKYIYRYLNRTDTVVKTDSIEVPVKIKTTEIKEVNKLKWYQTLFMWCGIILICLVLFKLYKVINKFKSIIKP